MIDSAVEIYSTKRPIYEAFCNAIRRIMESSFSQRDFRHQLVDARAKKVDSFRHKAEKLNEDGSLKYPNPLQEITDLAGARVIVFTVDDIKVVEKFIDESFTVLEKRDVGEERAEKGEFGYQSIHYLVQLTPDRLSLPDFTVYKDLICEIQIRTVLQHAWAEMEHDIQYKGSQNIPKSIRRKFLSLAGLIEIADREFSAIQREDAALKRDILINLQADITKDVIIRSGAMQASGASDEGKEFVESGPQVRTLLANRNYEGAIAVYSEKINSEPSSYTLYIGRARAYFLQGWTDLALKDLDVAESLSPGNQVVRSIRTQIETGENEVATGFHRTSANIRMREGDTALANGKPEDAFVIYSDAQAIGASWPFTTFKMALCSVAAKDFTGSDLILDSLRINPGTPMEINIAALRTILAALTGDSSFIQKLENLRNLLREKEDFDFNQSPLHLISGQQYEAQWGEHREKIRDVISTLRNGSPLKAV